MLGDALPHYLLVCLIFFAAGAVKGVVGLGLPTVAMGLLGLFMTVPQAAALLTVPSLATNLWQATAGPHLVQLIARLWRMQVAVVAGTVSTAALFPWQDDGMASRFLGACLILYAGSGLAGWRLPAANGRWAALTGVAAGAATGGVTAVTGVFVLPAVPYLQSMGLTKDELAQALGMSFTTSTLAMGIVLIARDELTAAASLQSFAVLLPALGGMLAGQALRRTMSEAVFRRCLFWGLLMLGAWLALR
ncbi:sulfite exporter TauE/SafE family protein [Ramlibacter sp. AN1015]|uniref:sulfite exporter TauE/SafE family protein n=1 Tax=Ramlibacter sp. AN1015 TaxID=3133428 RepID=UPI0030C3B316